MRKSILHAATVFILVLAAASACTHRGNAQSQSQLNSVGLPRGGDSPNIILIVADDLGVETINAYGGEYYTPNIDQLAAEGVRFENAHAMPACAPTRVRLMTGKESWRNYEAFSYLGPDERTFGNLLKESGYVTGIVGKWHLMGNGYDGRVGITPEAAGFDEHYLWQLNAADYTKGSRYWGPTRVSNGQARVHEGGFGPDDDNDFALDFIARHKKEKFFLYYPMVLTHSPFVQTPNSMGVDGEKARFAGMITYMDRLIGDLMAKLEAEGLDTNTIVIFTADNGTKKSITTMRNGRLVQGGKGLPTISGTHVPLIIWGPDYVPEGEVRDGLFDLADMFPTLADFAQTSPAPAPAPAPAPGAVDGVSQLPVIEGKQSSARDMIFMHYAPVWLFSPARFVFDADWKLYGDGRFVGLDAIAGIETEVSPEQLTGEAAKRYVEFTQALAEKKDGPLDPTRFPMCDGHDSLDPKQPATVAGCEEVAHVLKILESYESSK